MVGPKNVIGEIIDPSDKPIDALQTVRLQVEKVREWNCEAAEDALKEASDNLTGIKLTTEILEMQLTRILESPLLANAQELLDVLDELVTRFDIIRLRGYVGSNLFDKAHSVLKKAKGITDAKA
jgi:rRNA maturation endonuclease Nob1